MKALTFHGKGDIRCDSVPDPKIEHGRDAIIKVTSCDLRVGPAHIRWRDTINGNGRHIRP
jgi:threonine dehydrogenase-like Zn-dependent dehydrogenase